MRATARPDPLPRRFAGPRAGLPINWAVKTCVIFNPTARGDKARHFRRHLEEIGSQATLKLTTAVGDARRLGAEAVAEGFEIVVAAGGDGTVNEVLNGIGDAPQGFERVRLGVLPLGTVNVFARELRLPSNVTLAWELIRRERESAIDLPQVEFQSKGRKQKRYFAQLAGAGLDARAIELVQWELKKRIGPLAYVFAGLRALAGKPAKIQVKAGTTELRAGLVLVGNGRLYGGSFRLFPKADLRDGLLDVCVFERANWLTLARCGPPLLLRGQLPASAVRVFQAEKIVLSSDDRTPMEVDGELAGDLPASFSVERSRLRVIVP